MKEVRSENHGTVGSIRYIRLMRILRFKICRDLRTVLVEARKVPIFGGGHFVNHQAARIAIEICCSWCQPKVNVDCSKICVRVCLRLIRVPKTPNLLEALGAYQLGKGAAKLVGDLDEERAVEPLTKERPKPSVGITIREPDRRFQAKPSHTFERLFGKKAVDDNHAERIIETGSLRGRPTPPR